ncbi:hypothetical protein GF327_04590 [Candidatus Woesearchaeota archaeon]|nr:hypothetical protein [Candidatus Woesearchaeota archaeon]
MQLKKALQKAIDYEQKGYEVYSDRADKISNKVMKDTFSYLAEQELLHKKVIEEFAEKNSFNIESEQESDAIQFFNTTIKDFREELDLSDDEQDIYKKALELEKASFDYYSDLLEESEDESTRKFFKFLKEQENIHFEMLQKAYWFIKDPEGFFAEEEKWFVEG